MFLRYKYVKSIPDSDYLNLGILKIKYNRKTSPMTNKKNLLHMNMTEH